LLCLQEEFFLRFAEFEEMVKEHERARAIFQVCFFTLQAPRVFNE
jgi:hypothetical protein